MREFESSDVAETTGGYSPQSHQRTIAGQLLLDSVHSAREYALLLDSFYDDGTASMAVRGKCSKCGTTLNVKPELVGKPIKCPKCNEVQTIHAPPNVFGAADISALILVVLLFPAAIGAMAAFSEFGLWGGLSSVLSMVHLLLLGAIVVLLLQIKSAINK